jgi:hypothetical protein
LSDRIFGKDYDLKLLSFSSYSLYKSIQLSTSFDLLKNQELLVSGFPCDNSLCQGVGQIEFIPARFSEKPEKPLQNGYQIGFTGKTKPGTSGGPILNRLGQLVAINGLGNSAHGVFKAVDEQYQYFDGSDSSEMDKKKWKKLSWGISVDKFSVQLSSLLSQKIPINEVNPVIVYLQPSLLSRNSDKTENSFSLNQATITESLLLSLFIISFASNIFLLWITGILIFFLLKSK